MAFVPLQQSLALTCVLYLMQVRAWELRLGRVGETLATWLAVQRRWIYLEAIFSSSDDLRQQLPQARQGSMSA